MRIAFISPNIESEKAISILSSHIVMKIKEKGIEIDLITYTARSPSSFLKILTKLKKYDLIHIPHEYGVLGFYGLPFFFILPLIKLLNKKIIITMETVLSLKERFSENFLKSFLRKMLYIFQNKLINFVSDIIIVHEQFFKDILVNQYNFSANKIKIIPQGMREDVNLTNKNKAKKELKVSGNFYLLIGNLTSDSGADLILKQADKIGKTIIFATNPKAANTGNRKKVEGYINLNKKIIKKNKFEKFVRFDLKEIPNNLWWKYFSAADLILQAYRGGIRSGVFSDAMVSKKPVIASNIPFFREMAKKYDSLKIAENEGDYPRLIKEAMKPKNYQKMVNECKRYLRENSWSVVAEKYKKIYFSLINN